MENNRDKKIKQIEILKIYIETLKKDIEDWQEKTKKVEMKHIEIELELEGIKDLLASKLLECER